MVLVQQADADLGGKDAHELDVRAARFLDEADRRVGAAARRKRRVDDDDRAVLRVDRELEVVRLGQERLFIAVQADVPDLRRRGKRAQAVYHAEPRTQDRHDREVLGQHRRHDLLQRRLNLHILHFQVLEHLVAHQH